MSTYMVTGAAGFIGSHLCESLVDDGHTVVGVDALIPYYPQSLKRRNLERLLASDRFDFHALDLRDADLLPLLAGCGTIVHLAAMPGLRRSWTDFELYSTCNLSATQRLLEAARAAGIRHFIHGSTSSVYGRTADGPESAPLQPVSPYGVTKLAAEHLCRAYETVYGLPLTILRLFSVYGPRQRPDMAYAILIECLLHGAPFTRFGDGTQTRSNTYVADCVRGIRLAIDQPDAAVGRTFNLGGGETVSLNHVIALLEDLTGRRAVIQPGPSSPGDQQHTQAHIDQARRLLGFQPSTPIRDGLQAQVDWYRAQSVIPS